MIAVQRGTSGAPERVGETRNARSLNDVLEQPSYFEIEVFPLRVSIFERSGDGKTAALLRALSRFGIKLEERVNSPCG